MAIFLLVLLLGMTGLIQPDSIPLSAIANSKNPLKMANAMKHAVVAGRYSYLAGRMKKKIFGKIINKKNNSFVNI